MPIVIEQTEQQDKVSNDANGDYAVVAHNNEWTTFNNVVGVFVISCGYDEQVAFKYTKEIHEKGKSVCYWNSKTRCEEVINDFSKIKVKATLLENNK